MPHEKCSAGIKASRQGNHWISTREQRTGCASPSVSKLVTVSSTPASLTSNCSRQASSAETHEGQAKLLISGLQVYRKGKPR